MENLEIFGFRALWSPYYLTCIVAAAAFYLLLVTKGKHRATVKEKTLFLTGLVLLYAVKGSPIDLMGHIMFSAHMAQMAVLYLVIPPLLITGLPAAVWERIIQTRGIQPIFRLFSKPLIALLGFNGLFSLYHIPLVFDFVKTDPFYHALMTVVIFIAAFFMWWPLVHKVQSQPQITGILKLGYIMADGILMTPACALIMFSEAPIYATYSDAGAWIQALHLCVPSDMLAGLALTGPDMFHTLPLLEDQQLGAILMKIIQEIVYGSILAVVFFDWARKERAKDAVPDALIPKYE
ncbi:cytochrome c oxidase assembly factor CtaG [Bacillus altitudinis]|uniref:cytochrome c oxidase assembly factor CtaG n=1 Tax=Bacillus altitudinis TaxID=293387 RepID=UPI00201E661F|nr:cytochrome c oxidase assembly factor CtaG [Bacillus altitudinis]MCL6798546.1 cytochrome c oxidase assembly factor CtaG [Bacillus altitudinis]MDF9416967.1 cytochrome c oxidase assembly factor CtaG [Bacillus altitudinis]